MANVRTTQAGDYMALLGHSSALPSRENSEAAL
jgi:hypothetical protein